MFGRSRSMASGAMRKRTARQMGHLSLSTRREVIHFCRQDLPKTWLQAGLVLQRTAACWELS